MIELETDNPTMDATKFFLEDGGVVVTREALADACAMPVKHDIRRTATKVHICDSIAQAMRPWMRTNKGVPVDMRNQFDDADSGIIFGIEWVIHTEPEVGQDIFCLVEYVEATDGE
jgi:hypothetical protein